MCVARWQIGFVGDGMRLQKFSHVTFSSMCTVILIVRSCFENMCGAVANQICRRRHETAEILNCHIFFNVYSNLSYAVMY